MSRLPTRRAGRRALKVRLRARPGRRLRVKGRAPRRSDVILRLVRRGRVLRDRAVDTRRGRFATTFGVRRAGRYRVVALLRTREGVVRKRSRAVRVR